MKFTILGKYGPFPKAEGGTSSYFVEGERAKIALELGESSVSRVFKYVMPQKLDAIILTHMHFDHAGDTGVLNYYLERLQKTDSGYKKIDLYMPDDDTLLCQIIKSYKAFNIVFMSDGAEYDVNGIKIKFIKVNHPVLCYGVKFTESGKTFSFTGDSNICPALDKIFENSDICMADGAFLFKDWSEKKPHMSVKHAAELGLKFNCKTIITHINPLYDEKEILNEARSVYNNTFLAEEGKTYEV